ISGGGGEGHIADAGPTGGADAHISRASDDGQFAVADRDSEAARSAVAMAVIGAAIHRGRAEGKAAAAGGRASDGGGAAVVGRGDGEGHVAGAGAAGGADTEVSRTGDD